MKIGRACTHPAHVSEFECLSLGSNPGHKVTKRRVLPLGDMGRLDLRLSYQRLKFVAAIRRNKYSYILVRDYSDDRLTCGHTRHFRRSTSDGHPMLPELVLFPTCCCVIIFLLFCCFRYSWCVTRLMGHAKCSLCIKKEDVVHED